jgi:hypothetical protein
VGYKLCCVEARGPDDAKRPRRIMRGAQRSHRTKVAVLVVGWLDAIAAMVGVRRSASGLAEVRASRRNACAAPAGGST